MTDDRQNAMTATVHLVYFSATGTTRRVVEQVAAGLGAREVVHHDLTSPAARTELALRGGVAVVGVPVHSGRVPELAVDRLRGLSGTGVPAVLVAVYGNRAFEDALVELRDLVVAKGFPVVGAGAFVGEHSYSTPERPIAAGRPDAEDLRIARDLGARVAARLREAGRAPPVELPGNVPYRDRTPPAGFAPVSDAAACTRCGTCADACPAGVIHLGDEVTTAAAGCILCCACTRVCPSGARTIAHPAMEARRATIAAKCAVRRESALFL